MSKLFRFNKMLKFITSTNAPILIKIWSKTIYLFLMVKYPSSVKKRALPKDILLQPDKSGITGRPAAALAAVTLNCIESYL